MVICTGGTLSEVRSGLGGWKVAKLMYVYIYYVYTKIYIRIYTFVL